MESRIVKNAISGDIEALTLLINKYKDIAFNLALSIVKNKENAKDITQDSFLKVLENIGRFRSEAKFSTWLYRIVYNQSIGFVNKTKKMTSIDNEPILIFENSYKINDNQEEQLHDLYHAIDLLEDTEKNIILLFYLADKTVKEIAHITDMSISNIKVILYRTRKKLKEKLENAGAW
jgi:RNA polymerase sigma factor (sigma-70 family)